MKRLLLLLACACTVPTEPVHQPLEGYYEVLDFYFISTCGDMGAYLHTDSDFRLELRPFRYAATTDSYYAEYRGRADYQGYKALMIEPFKGRYEIVNDTLQFLNTGQTWLNEARFAQWRDGTLIGRWEPFCRHIEVTFRRIENGY